MMKCKRCGTKEDVVKYGRGLTYRGVPLLAGSFCHSCVIVYKEAIDMILPDASTTNDGATDAGSKE